MLKKLSAGVLVTLALFVPLAASAATFNLDSINGTVTKCLTPIAGQESAVTQQACADLIKALIAIVLQLTTQVNSVTPPTTPPPPASTPTSCPVYQQPLCPAGQSLVSEANTTSDNGCTVPHWHCASSTTGTPSVSVTNVSFPSIFVSYSNLKPAGVEVTNSQGVAFWSQELTQGSQSDTTSVTSGTRVITVPTYIPPGFYTLRAFGPQNVTYATSPSFYLGAGGPTTTNTKGTLQLTYNGSSLPAISNVSKEIAQMLCGMTMVYSPTQFQNGICLWENQNITFVPIGGKEGDAHITFVKPASGQNETITIGGSYPIYLTDGKVASSYQRYKVYLAQYSQSDSSKPQKIYEATISSGSIAGNNVSLIWNFAVNNGSMVIPAGSYYLSAYNLDTGTWGNVSAYTFLVGGNTTTPPPATPPSTPTLTDWVGGCANPPVYTGPEAHVGQYYSYDPGVYNAGAPYPSLPQGLTKANGIIMGTPTTPGAVSVKVFATNSCGAIRINFNIVSATTGTPTSCPVYQQPLCPVGQILTSDPNTTSDNGCTVPHWHCAPSTTPPPPTNPPTTPAPTVEIKAGAGNTTSANGTITLLAGTPMSIWWNSTNASSCSVTANPTNVAMQGSTSGLNNNFQFVSTEQPTTFTAKCIGLNGQQVTSSVTITATPSGTCAYHKLATDSRPESTGSSQVTSQSACSSWCAQQSNFTMYTCFYNGASITAASDKYANLANALTSVSGILQTLIAILGQR